MGLQDNMKLSQRRENLVNSMPYVAWQDINFANGNNVRFNSCSQSQPNFNLFFFYSIQTSCPLFSF